MSNKDAPRLDPIKRRPASSTNQPSLSEEGLHSLKHRQVTQSSQDAAAHGPAHCALRHDRDVQRHLVSQDLTCANAAGGALPFQLTCRETQREEGMRHRRHGQCAQAHALLMHLKAHQKSRASYS